MDILVKPGVPGGIQPAGFPVQPGSPDIFCDVQLTYNMDLAVLLNDLDGWKDTWGSTWLFEFRTPDDQIRKLDPPNGLERWRNPVQDDAYRT